jgi:anti-sigma-K factor RskA
MKYDQPELQMKLAAEYVLGTLHGKARTRFERLLSHDSGLRGRVAAWEQRLSPWASALEPMPVPAGVWSGVQRRLGQTPVEAPRPAPWWRLWAFGSTALAAALAGFIVLQPAPQPAVPAPVVVAAPTLTDLAVLTDKEGPNWIVRVDSAHQKLVLSSLGNKPLPADKALELWSIPAGGSPMSLGVLPVHNGRAELALDTLHQTRLQQASVLAISLEPSGGSPTGQPTGPVLYTGKPVSV